jgi:uncharacterized protein (TIRG00374 family)
VRHSFSQANPLLLTAAIAASAATNFLRACRWRTLLSPFTPVSFHDVFVSTNIGIGASFLFGAALGEIIRPMTLPLLNRQVRPGVSFLTIMVERVCDFTVLFLFFGLTLLWLPLVDHPEQSARIREIGMILLTVPWLGLGVLILFKTGFLKMPNWLGARFAQRQLASNDVRHAVSRFLHQLTSALKLLSNTRESTGVALWSAGQWLANLLAAWLTLGAFGNYFGPKETLLVVCCGIIGSMVPTPGGAAGAFHIAFSGGLIFLGITIERAAAISIATHLVGFAPALAFGSYYLLRGGISLTQLRRNVSEVAQGGERWPVS